MIAIIDYGAGNLRSVRNALTYLNVEVITASNPDQLDGVAKIVLPGVGAFGAGINALRQRGFETPIKEAVAGGTPLFGICLGLQYLFESSDEMGQHEGLGILPGHVTHFPDDGPKVPHIGWNQLHIQQSHPLLYGIPDDAFAYFVHSYYVVPAQGSDVLATTEYGLPFAAIAGRDKVYGIQCHPEKSQTVGLRILKNFIDMEAAP